MVGAVNNSLAMLCPGNSMMENTMEWSTRAGFIIFHAGSAVESWAETGLASVSLPNLNGWMGVNMVECGIK